MSKKEKEPIKKVCALYGDVFVTGSHSRMNCPSCVEFCKKYRAKRGGGVQKTKMTGNMAAIERVNREAEAQGLSYGKAVGQEYAQEHVRVVRKESNNE